MGQRQCGGDRGKGESYEGESRSLFNLGAQRSQIIEDGDFAPLSLANGRANTGLFGISALCIQAVLTTFFFFTGYDFSSLSVFDSTESYDFFCAGAVMLFVGFGFIMTFLKAYGIGAVGFTLFIGALGLQWALLLQGWMTTDKLAVNFNIVSFIRANYGVAAVLISFGAMIGKTSPMQILTLTMMEIVAYTANKVYCLNRMNVHDVGGTIGVHVFGAFFGVAASVAMTPPQINEDYYSSTYTSDLLSILGTVFMWLFWPSFVSGDLAMGTAMQKMALVNTVFALLGSTVTVFAVTTIISKKRLTTLPIQMATLAGGVAIGAVANYPVVPGGAVLIGMGAGTISCCMFVYGHNILPDRIDTCGVMSLHGVPGLYGGAVSVFLPLFLKEAEIDTGYQALGVLSTIMGAIVSGSITGWAMKSCGMPAVAYNDEAYWDTA